MTDPQAIAQLAAETMWATDTASQALAMQIIAIAPGTARLAMDATPAMLNGHGSVHGGYLFILADSAFAYACNSYGETTVAAHCTITFIKPGAHGTRLMATAHELSRVGRSGIYDVSISADGVTIAEFRGHSRSLGSSFLPKEHT